MEAVLNAHRLASPRVLRERSSLAARVQPLSLAHRPQRRGRLAVHAVAERLSFTATRSDYVEVVEGSVAGRTISDYLAQPAVWPSLLGAPDSPNVQDGLLICSYGRMELLGQVVTPTLYLRAKYDSDDHGTAAPGSKALLRFALVKASFGSDDTPLGPFGSLSGLAFSGTVEVNPVPGFGPVPRVVVSANVALSAAQDTPEIPPWIRSNLESAANTAIQVLLDRAVPQALARLKEDYVWWAGLSATTSGAPAFRRPFGSGGLKPQYLAPVAVENADTESAYVSAVRAAIMDNWADEDFTVHSLGPGGAETEDAAQAAAAGAGEQGRAMAAAKGLASRPRRRQLYPGQRSALGAGSMMGPATEAELQQQQQEQQEQPAAAAHTPAPAPAPAQAAAQQPPQGRSPLRSGTYVPYRRMLHGTFDRAARAAKAAGAAAAEAPSSSSSAAAASLSPLRTGTYAAKKRVLQGTLGREARLASFGADVAPATAAAAATASEPAALTKAASASLAAPAPSSDPVAAAVDSMGEVSRCASHALFVAALVVRRGMEAPEEARRALIDQLLGELHEAELALLEARATEKAAVAAAQAALAKQREEQRGSVVVATTLLDFARSKSAETVLNAEEMLVKAESALEGMRVSGAQPQVVLAAAAGAAPEAPSAAQAAAAAQAADMTAAVSAAATADRALGAGATQAEVQSVAYDKLGRKPAGEEPFGAAAAAAGATGSSAAAAAAAAAAPPPTPESAAKKIAAEWLAADAAAAERSIHFDEFASGPGVTKSSAARSLRFDVLEPLDAQGRPILPLESFVADADNLVRLAVRDENLKRVDEHHWEICVTQIRIGSFSFVPVYKLEMRYAEGKGLLARSGDIELAPEGMPEILRNIPIHLRMNTWVTVDRQLLKDKEEIPYGDATARMAVVKADVSIEVAAGVPQVPGLSLGLRQVGDTVLSSILSALQAATESVLERNYLARVAKLVRVKQERASSGGSGEKKKKN